MSDNINTQERPPEVQFAGVNRWLRENLFSSTGSSILTFLSIGVIIGLFRSIIGFFISPEREWTAITYNLRLYMVQAYPESDFIRVWITIGVVMGLLGLTWGFNSISEKVSLKSTSTSLMKLFSSIFLLVLIAPSSVVIDKVEGTQVEVFQQSLRLYLLGIFGILLLLSYLVRTKLSNQEAAKDYLNLFYVGLLVVTLWVIKVPTVTFDSSNVRLDPDPLMPLATSTKTPWTFLYLLLIATFFIGKYLNSKNVSIVKRVLPVSWLLTPLVVVTWIYRKPDFTLTQIATLDLPVILGFSVVGYLVINYLNSEKLMHITFDNIEIVLNSNRCQAFSTDIFTKLGINLLEKKILIIKSTNHFYNSFKPHVSKIIYASINGIYPNDPKKNNYKKLKRKIWPIVSKPHNNKYKDSINQLELF